MLGFASSAQPTELNIKQGGATVFTMDMPDVPQHYASAIIAQADQTEAVAANKERAMGICYGVDYNPTGQEHSDFLSPQTVAREYFWLYEKKKVDVPPLSNVELVEQPKHGKVVYTKFPSGLLHPTYIPAPGYVGDEKIVFKVNVDGMVVRVLYLIKVTDKGADSLAAQDICKKTGDRWKISSINNDPTGQLSTFDSPNQLANYLVGAINVDINIADLASGAVGQTTATTITLDDNAAGFGWFIDTTPGSNDEFLPTHNPNEWIAKFGRLG